MSRAAIYTDTLVAEEMRMLLLLVLDRERNGEKRQFDYKYMIITFLQNTIISAKLNPLGLKKYLQHNRNFDLWGIQTIENKEKRTCIELRHMQIQFYRQGWLHVTTVNRYDIISESPSQQA